MADHDTHDHTGIPGVGIAATLYDTKGDILAASAADTPAKLAVGANGSSLRAASGQTTGLEWQLNKYDATVAPTANEDTGDGYSVGSIWIDVTGDAAYICVDATAAAAVWIPFDTGGGGDSAFSAAVVAHADVIHHWPLSEAYTDLTHDDVVGSKTLTQFAGSNPFRGPNLCRDEAHLSSFQKDSSANGLAAASPLTWPSAWTIFAWMVWESSAADGVAWSQWNGSGHMVALQGTNFIAWFGGGTITWACGNFFTDGLPHLVAVKFDSGTAKINVDGVERASEAETGPTSTAGAQWGVGLYSGSGVTSRFYMQMLSVFDAALSDADLLDFYDLGKAQGL